MTRGPKPAAAIAEAKKFAEKMGYRWMENPHTDLGFHLFLFKLDSARIVRVRQTRHRIDPETFYEDLIPDDLREVRGLPFPNIIPKEIWLRTQHERVWRRLLIYDISVCELEWWGPDDYVNPHAKPPEK